ncbi:hypothetical protein [Kitasatospora sp. NBC_01300]|uniref:hypothetical protein n=1 Tax=Kitasatospora sp. NBC_01300 TaxID=2903574 RepID=UPI00352F87AF|nr:hypothetical protein OG556_28880 [Kitasatospora sp. NBC_01300]
MMILSGFRTARRATGLAAAGLAVVLLTGCSGGAAEAELAYKADYAAHPHLRVTGYPSTGTLGVVQQVVWRLAEGAEGRLAELGVSDGMSASDGMDGAAASAAWVREFGRGAQGAVTADFQDDPAERQTVVLTFHDTGQVKELVLRPGGRDGGDGCRVVLR